MCDARFFYIPTTMRLAVASQKPQFCIRQLSPFMRWLLIFDSVEGQSCEVDDVCRTMLWRNTPGTEKTGKITFLSLNKFISINYD